MKNCTTCKYYCHAVGLEIWCSQFEDMFKDPKWSTEEGYCYQYEKRKKESGLVE